MTYRRAAIPAVVGGLLVTVLLWWAGASAHTLRLPGSAGVLGGGGISDLERWLIPWSYDPLGGVAASGGRTAGSGTQYFDLHHTAMQIRFFAVFVFFALGALPLLRRLPPVGGRTPAVLCALWAWGVVVGTLAVTVSAPWLVASRGHGSYRFLPHLSSAIASGRQILLAAALLAAAGTVLLARVTAEGAEQSPRPPVPARAARLAASVGTAVVALSLLVLSYTPVAAALQTGFSGRGLYSEPGDLIRQWLLLGGWAGPGSTQLDHWLLYRIPDVLLLALLWWALRRLPVMLTRATVPVLAVGTVCATVLALLASQVLRAVLSATSLYRGLPQVIDGVTAHVPAAFTVGLVAGLAAAVTLRLAGGTPSGATQERSGLGEA